MPRPLPLSIALMDHILELCQDPRDYGQETYRTQQRRGPQVYTTDAPLLNPPAYFYPHCGLALVRADREDEGTGKLEGLSVYVLDVAGPLTVDDMRKRVNKPPRVVCKLYRAAMAEPIEAVLHYVTSTAVDRTSLAHERTRLGRGRLVWADDSQVLCLGTRWSSVMGSGVRGRAT